ncbi:MAG: hypothetical protein KDK12_07965 [Rhodobacteraceae bacterium]|nr:hypothetical protein [Paracoccaceae bacterium]
MTADLYADNPERIDHYGRPSKWFLDYPEAYLDALVAELKALELVLQVEFGLPMYLTWGTLLGAVREGGLIAHDFDIDVAYVSRARSSAGVLAEQRRIRAHFERFGRVIGKPSPGRFMIAAARAPSGLHDHGIELWTSFTTGGAHYAYPTLPGVLPARAVRPFRTATLRGIPFNVPRQAERFLDLAIGPDWRVPKLPGDHSDRARRYACFRFLYPD